LLVVPSASLVGWISSLLVAFGGWLDFFGLVPKWSHYVMKPLNPASLTNGVAECSFDLTV
jgi:hypothetical protein